MWLQLGELGLWAGLYIFNRLTAPEAPKPIPRTRDSLSLPRTEEGTPVPIVFGRCQVSSPVLVWTSDLDSVLSPDGTYYTYGLSMLFVAGLPMGAGTTTANGLRGALLHNVWMGDKLLPSPGQLPRAGTDYETAKAVFRTNFLGGPSRGGGLVGSYEWFGGYTDQNFLLPEVSPGVPESSIGRDMLAFASVSSVMTSTTIPGHRKQMCVAFSHFPQDSSDPSFARTQTDTTGGTHDAFPLPAGFTLGENPDISGIAFEISSYGDCVGTRSDGFSGPLTQHYYSMDNPGVDFGGDADPIEVIRDILINPWGRLGLDASIIDDTSFLAASLTLKGEGHGYSRVHYSSEDAHRVLSDICAQIDAALYQEPTTGKFVIKLVRADYTPGDPSIPVFDESNIVDVTDYALGGWRDTVNEIRVQFTERSNNYSTGVAVANSMANAVGNGNRRRSKTVQYLGVSNATLAATLAARDMNVLSTPLAKITIVTNRDGSVVRPGTVISVSFAKYGLANVIFRATRIDLGQLEDNKVTIDAIQDAFPSTAPGMGQHRVTAETLPSPFSTNVVVEAPRWLAHEAQVAGLIDDAASTRLLMLPSKPENATEYLLQTRQTNGFVSVFTKLGIDIPRHAIPLQFTVAVDYPRTAEPYDTSTGLVISGGDSAVIAAISATTQNGLSSISTHGSSLCALITATGDVEFIAFETATSLGGGQYRLNNVWRGLLDTAPLAHVAGERGVGVAASMIGRRAWSPTKALAYVAVPCSGKIVGSGNDPITTFTSSGYPTMANTFLTPRGFLPYPPSNVGLLGRGLKGSPGTGGVLGGSLKSVTLLDEGVDPVGLKRFHRSPFIVRGDVFNDVIDSTMTLIWEAFAWPAGRYQPTRVGGYTDGRGAYTPTLTVGAASSTYQPGSFYLAGALYRFDMFGSIEVGMTSKLTLSSGDPDVGKGGISSGQVMFPWTEPRITCFAPAWRNLLCNVDFAYPVDVATNMPWGWNNPLYGGLTGVALIGSGTFSLSRAGTYLSANSASFAASQVVQCDSWKARGLTAIGIAYLRNANSDTNDTGQIAIADQTGTIASSTPVVAPTGVWSRQRVAATLTSAGRLTMRLIATEVAGGGGSANADTSFDETELRIGQFFDNVLLNYSFETGLTSWTTDVGTMTTSATVASPSANYAINATAANAQIHQDFAIYPGWETGSTLFLTCFRGSRVATNTGEVIVQALDVSNNVLASGTTGAEAFTGGLDTWNKRTVFCDVPDGSVTARVIFKANYTSGATSGQMVDEVALWLAKDLVTGGMDGQNLISFTGPLGVNQILDWKAQNARYQLPLDFSSPTVQPTPATWQEFVIAYPSVPRPDRVFGGTDVNEHEVVWTDGVTRTEAKVVAQFGGGVASIDGYPFVRGTGATAPHLAAIGQGVANYGAPSLATPFTCVALYRIDEVGFSTACGIVGRMNLANGWGLELDASGHPTAILRGNGATTKTVSTSRVHTEGGLHLIALINDPVAQLLYVVDEQGFASISTASGLGEIASSSATCHLRLGRDADDRAVMPGQIARVWIWEDTALTTTQVASLWSYAKDPTGQITTYTRTAAAAWAGPTDADGETLVVGSATQVAIPYKSTLTSTNFVNADPTINVHPTGFGLAVGRATTNRIQSFDFSNATFWSPDASTTLTQGIVDPTGRPHGVTVAGNATNGLTALGVTVGAVANTVGLSFWMRSYPGGGANDVTVELRTSAGTLVTSTTVTSTPLWKRYDVALAWAGATATCRWRILPTSGTMSFDLGGVTYCGEHTTTNQIAPALIPAAAATHGDYNATITTTLPVQFNSEGEIVIYLNDWANDPAKISAASLVTVKNGSNNKNRREVQTTSSGKLRLAHADGTGTIVNSDLTPAAGLTSHVVKARGRWCRADMLDTNAPMTAQVAYSDNASPGNSGLGGAGRTAIWTNDTTPSTTIMLGTGTAAPDDVLFRGVVIQAREEKLP